MTNLLNDLPPSDAEIEQSILETEANLRKGREIYNQLNNANCESRSKIDSRILDSFLDSLPPADYKCLQEYNNYINREENSEFLQSQDEQKGVLTYQPVSKETVSESIDRFISVKSNKGLRNKTILGDKQKLETFCEIIGNPNIQDLARHHIQHYQNTLPSVPRNMNKLIGITPSSIEDKINMPGEKIGTLTIINNAKVVQKFLRWCYEQDNTSKDLSSILKGIATKTKKSNENTARYSIDELSTIFSIPDYQHHCFRKYPYKYWTPLIALYTGARQMKFASYSSKT